MNPQRRTDSACAAACFLFSAVYFFLAIRLESSGIIEDISTRFLPELLSVVIMGLSVLLFVSALLLPPEKAEDEEPEQADRPAFYGTVAVGILSMFTWMLVGFASMPLLIAGVMAANRERSVFRIVSVALGATLALYLLFFQLFELQMPLGLLE